MEQRMTNPAMLFPETYQAVQALGASSTKAGLPERTVDLVHLRASQINGCSLCVDMHAADGPEERGDRPTTLRRSRLA